MRFHAESIRGTAASSLAAPRWGRFTQRGNVVYAHIFEWPVGRPLLLPIDSSFVSKIELLGSATPPALTYTASAGASVLVDVPVAPANPFVTVVRVTLTE
jgi:alpha-L-fucosidase